MDWRLTTRTVRLVRVGDRGCAFGSRPGPSTASGPQEASSEAPRSKAGRSEAGRSEAGMVTAELAVGLLSVAVVLALMLFAIAVGIAHVRTQEAARAGARAAARGDATSDVRAVARSAVPGARVRVTRAGSAAGSRRVTVQVLTDVHLPLAGIRAMTVSSSSVAELETQ